VLTPYHGCQHPCFFFFSFSDLSFSLLIGGVDTPLQIELWAKETPFQFGTVIAHRWLLREQAANTVSLVA
jgi:hypothetical protein